MNVLQKLYDNILSELQNTDEKLIDSIISRRLMLSEKAAFDIRKGIIEAIRKYDAVGEPLDYYGTFREKVAMALTLLIGSELGYIKKITPEESGVIASYISDMKEERKNSERSKEKALQTGIISEEFLNLIVREVEPLLKEGEESADPIYNLIKNTVKLFDKYGDKLIINYENTIDSVLEEIFKDVSHEDRIKIENKVREFFESRRLKEKKETTFVKDRDVEELLKKIIAFDGKGVRIPSIEERILLGLIIYKHFEEHERKSFSDEGRLVLSALIGDILYLIWLIKNQFVDLTRFKTYLKEVLSHGLHDARDKDKVLNALKVYLFPVWGALEEHQSVIEKLAEEELDKTAEEYAVKVFFGSKENYEKTKEIITDFVESAVKELPESREEWLEKKFKEYPEIWQSEEEIKKTIKLIVKEEEKGGGIPLKEQKEEKKEHREDSSFVERATSVSGEVSQIDWTSRTDKVIEEGNKLFERYGERRDSFGLHGELAEEWHAETFNIDATVKGKNYEARVFGRNTRNSVDIGIIDKESGKVVRRYQSKYGKTPEATASYLEDGDYRGQRPLVPSDQVEEVTELRAKKGRSPATDRLEYDGVKSKPLTRKEAERLKEKVKNREKVFNWKENVTYKEAFKRIGKDSAKVFAVSLLARGVYRLGKAIFSSNTSLKKELQAFLKEDVKGAFIPALKTAVTGATIVAARKGFIKFLKNTPAGKIAATVEVAFRSASIIKKMWNGELSFKEGIKEIAENGVCAVGGLAGAVKGAAIGAAIGSAIPLVGTVIGSFVGGVVGGMLGEKVAKKSIKVVKTIKEKVTQTYNKVKNTVRNVFKRLINVFA